MIFKDTNGWKARPARFHVLVELRLINRRFK